MDEVAEYIPDQDKNPATTTSSVDAAQAAANWAAAAAAQQGGYSEQAYGQAGGGYPYPGYYYNPYAYAQYAMPQQGWAPQQMAQVGAAPSQQQQQQQQNASPVPAPGAVHAAANAGPAGGSAAQAASTPGGADPKRLQLLAKSVSITVNHSGQPPIPGGAPPPGVAMMGMAPGAMLQPLMPHPAYPPLQPPAQEMEQQQQQHVERTLQRVTEQAIQLHAWQQARRSMLRRCLRAWGRMCEERWWKTQLELRDQQVQLLASRLRHIEARPVRYIRRLRMRRFLHSWVAYCARKQAKRAAVQRAEAHAQLAVAGRGLGAWARAASRGAAKAAAGQQAAQLHQRRRMLQVFSTWQHAVGRRAGKAEMLRCTQVLRHAQLLRMALGRWRYLSKFYLAERRAVEQRRRLRLPCTLHAWRRHVQRRRAAAANTQKVQKQHAANLRHWAFYGWRAYADGKLARALHEEHERLRAEHEQLRQESERLGRVIDSGDWGRERVAELMQAGHVLQQERDALVKLVESLPGSRSRRGSRLSVQGTAAAAATAAAAVSVATTDGSAVPSSLAASGMAYGLSTLPAGSRRGSLLGQPSLAAALATAPLSAAGPPSRGGFAAARNKLNVKTGSSFNALVRALKQDLLTSGTLARDPAAVAAVDKLSVHRLTVADGDVRVEAVRNLSEPGLSFARAGLEPRKAPRPAGEAEQGGDAGAARKQDELLQVALKLQSIGGRSVTVGKRLA